MMLLSSLFVAGAFVASCAASPVSSPLVIHEKRSNLPPGWIKKYTVDGSSILPMRIALAQSNLDQAHEWLMDVSSPGSEKYGKHWSAEEVANAFMPHEDHVDAVKVWLASAGINDERIRKTQSMGWLSFDATIDEAERLLDTKYHVYEHEETGQPHVACEEYKIPASLKDKIDFVYPSIHFDAKLKRRGEPESDLEKRKFGPWSPGNPKNPGKPGGGSLPKWNHWWLPHSDIIKELKNCDTQITPWCLRYLYKFPPGSSKNPQNSYGIVEYTPQAYVPSDLDLFFKNFSTKQVGERPILDSIDGGYVQQTNMSFGFNGESDLDLEYAMTLVYPQAVTLYQVGDAVEGASFNDFLDALDSTYCSGDDPTQDAAYPDPNCSPASQSCYKGPKNCGGFAATKVISTSYAYNEHDLTPAYEMRQCNEYMKLGLMGVSVLYSSGDYGVAGNGGQCIDGAGADAPYNNGTSGRFNPSFPGTCPYITSVGATQVKPGTNILASRTQPEQACETVIYSGGGFSNVFSLPSYQANAVHSWFKNHPPPYGADRFNNSQQTRGFPDISANGANYVVAIDGKWALVYGTSASSPTLGSILTLINEARYNSGKSSIGFINPVAYAHPEVFNDITEGGNQGCGTPGFSAATGWDPVTGLGTPNYPKMKQLFLSM